MKLRPYQEQMKFDIYNAWAAGARNVLGVAATGSGKTVLFSEIIKEHQGASVAMAHRSELVSQISLSLARNGVRHRIIGGASTAHNCRQLHLLELGVNYVEPSAPCAVAGVDTLIRMTNTDPWLQQVTLGICDEAHHLAGGKANPNKWYKSTQMFPNARWLGVSATPMRADGQGLGRHADGIMDAMVLAPSMRDLIRAGYLTDYKVYAPPSDIDLSNVPTSAGGDYSPEPLRKAVHQSQIVGDVVGHYLKIASGKLGVTFAVDVESAAEISAAFNAAGVRAEVITAKTPDMVRSQILRKFRNREIMQLINVDIFSEGFDLPAIEVVSMARPTQSFPLYAQQFGRALRLMVGDELIKVWDTFDNETRCMHIAQSGKPKAIVIDHVSNVYRHGLPDKPRVFSLERREKRSKAVVVIPVRTCPNCAASYERVEICCPHCGFEPIPPARHAPHHVDGDLHEMSEELLTKLRSEIDAPPKFPYGAAPEVVAGIRGHWWRKKEAQESLRDMMALWAGYRTQETEGPELRRVMKEFYLTFGMDVLTAQSLSRADAEKLTEEIRKTI